MPKHLLFRITIANLVCRLLLETKNTKTAHAAVVGAGPADTGHPKPCPTCSQAIGLDTFRASVGGEITPVIIELQDSPGLRRRMAAEKAGRAMTVKDLISHGATLQARQKGFSASLPTSGVRALLRETDTRQIDGSVRHVQYQLTYLLNGFVAFVA